MTLVKICGITNLADARCAAESGAGMLGFILYPRSPRYVDPERVATITREVRGWGLAITTVGVFVNETPAHILGVLDAAGLDLAQLSGDEPPEALAALAGRAYKAVRAASQVANYLAVQSRDVALQGHRLPDLLLDADHPTLYGGSGLRAEESLAASIARQCRLMLAGGLTPDNVAEAIRRARPWGVDVSSGVEAAPGKKDHGKVRAFVQAAPPANPLTGSEIR